MDAVEPFFVVGGYSGAEGPGFCTPVFQSRTSNYLAIQGIAKNDRIVGFLSIEDEGLSRAEYINQGLSRRPGLKAYYAFRKSDGSLRIDTRGRLRRTLVSEYEKLRDRPFLRRTIARFVGDRDLYQSADRDVKRLIEKGFVHHSKNARMLGDGDIERLFVERQEYRLLVENLQRGLNTIVFGRRGSGKTHCSEEHFLISPI